MIKKIFILDLSLKWILHTFRVQRYIYTYVDEYSQGALQLSIYNVIDGVDSFESDVSPDDE